MNEEINEYEQNKLVMNMMNAQNAHNVASDIMREMAESVSGAKRYDGGKLEAIVVIEALGELLASRGVSQSKIYALQQVIRYIWRIGAKDDIDIELGKAINYLTRARTGKWLEK